MSENEIVENLAAQCGETRESLLGFLRGLGTDPKIVGRVATLMGCFASLDEFFAATPGALSKAYCETHPGAERGLGKVAFAAIDAARTKYRSTKCGMKYAARDEIARAAAEEERAALRSQIENERAARDNEVIDLAAMAAAVAALQVAGCRNYPVGELVTIARRIAAQNGGANAMNAMKEKEQ